MYDFGERWKQLRKDRATIKCITRVTLNENTGKLEKLEGETIERTIERHEKALKFYSAHSDRRHGSEFHFDDGTGIPRYRLIVEEKC